MRRKRGAFNFDRPSSAVKRQLKSEQDKLLRQPFVPLCTAPCPRRVVACPPYGKPCPADCPRRRQREPESAVPGFTVSGRRMKSKAQLDKRDRRLLHKVRVAAEYALRRQARGHSDGWQRLRDALDTADDEMGAMEDFKP